MNANIEYELRAAVYNKMTGRMAPGKDVPLAYGSPSLPPHLQQAHWVAFNRTFGLCIEATIEAASEAYGIELDAAAMKELQEDEPRKAYEEKKALEDEATDALLECHKLHAEVRELKALLADMRERRALENVPTVEAQPPHAEASPTWHYVHRFALRMEEKLSKNRHKGDRDGWLKDSPMVLLGRLNEESMELYYAIRNDHTCGEIADEAADVANFAMMIADRVFCATPATPTQKQQEPHD